MSACLGAIGVGGACSGEQRAPQYVCVCARALVCARVRAGGGRRAVCAFVCARAHVFAEGGGKRGGAYFQRRGGG